MLKHSLIALVEAHMKYVLGADVPDGTCPLVLLAHTAAAQHGPHHPRCWAAALDPQLAAMTASCTTATSYSYEDVPSSVFTFPPCAFNNLSSVAGAIACPREVGLLIDGYAGHDAWKAGWAAVVLLAALFAAVILLAGACMFLGVIIRENAALRRRIQDETQPAPPQPHDDTNPPHSSKQGTSPTTAVVPVALLGNALPSLNASKNRTVSFASPRGQKEELEGGEQQVQSHAVASPEIPPLDLTRIQGSGGATFSSQPTPTTSVFGSEGEWSAIFGSGDFYPPDLASLNSSRIFTPHLFRRSIKAASQNNRTPDG